MKEEDSPSKNARVESIHIIALRRSHLEFTNLTLSKTRQEIHQSMTELKKLIQSYQQKERELKIVEAEAQWKLSWNSES
jgi:hypothetical protein